MRYLRTVTGGSLLALFALSLFLYPLRITSLVPTYSIETTVTKLPQQHEVAQVETVDVTETTFATTTLFLLGDVMLARHVEQLMGAHGFDYPYKELSFLTAQPSYVLANFEGSIPASHKKTPDFGYVFSVTSSTLPALRSAGITHVSLANNHSYDRGKAGYENTVSTLVEHNIVPIGVPQGLASTSVTVIDLGYVRLGVLAVHTLTEVPDSELLKRIVTDLSAYTDVQLAYVHWGNEYVKTPADPDRQFASLLTKTGIDLIVGHHPHVTQSIEFINDVLVFYSLGNFIFDQYFSDEVREGLILKLEASESGTIRLSLLPVTSKIAQAQPRLMNSEDRTRFLNELASISDAQLQASILSGAFVLNHTLASSTEIAIMNR